MTADIFLFRDYRAPFDQRIAQLASLSRSYVLIGIQQGSITHAQVRSAGSTARIRRKQPGLSMPEIGYQNEFGIGIPQRSFIRQPFDRNLQALINLVERQFDMIVAGNSTLRHSLNLIGLFVQRNIITRINTIRHPPNSPLTIRNKGSSKPLIDFGQMRQSIRHRIFIG
jgi:hypothetical protein